MADATEIEMKTYRSKYACCQPFVCLPILWSTISGLGLVAVGVYDLLRKDDPHFVTGIFLLSVGGVVIFLEVLSILALTCCRKMSCCLKYTRLVGWFDTWKRGSIYVIAGLLCFLGLFRTTYSFVCGISMILAGSLYIMKTCKVRAVAKDSGTDRRVLTEDMHDQQQKLEV